MSISEKINEYLNSPDNYFQSILDSDEFFFQKGKNALVAEMEFQVPESEKKSILNDSEDYRKFEQLAQENDLYKNILSKVNDLVAYCDVHAKNKEELNEYNDKRVLAKAGVRQAHWLKHILLHKLGENKKNKNSVINAIKYLEKPNENSTILSEEHRRMVSEKLLGKEYNPTNFINDLKEYFQDYNVQVKNQENYTYAISTLCYKIKDVWHESIEALMASDGTGWQDNHIIETRKNGASVVWNSKKPTKGNATLKSLRAIIEDVGEFKLYYSSKGKVRYIAFIEDFVINQEQLDKKEWEKKYPNIFGYSSVFGDYADEKKHGNIVFLINRFEAIEPIDISEFNFYQCDPPRQDNLSPVDSAPEQFSYTTVQPQLNLSNTENHVNMIPLNTILYGPPGTGKTYNTINKALEICGVDIQEMTRSAIKAEYDKLVSQGKIIFTTFHQSMSYEDFIEGIKPQEPKDEDKPIWYKVEDGIFKRACNKAILEHYSNNEEEQISQFSEFDTLYDDYIDNLKNRMEELAEGKQMLLDLKSKGYYTEVKSINEEEEYILTRGTRANSDAKVRKENLRLLYKKFPSIDDVKEVSTDIRSVGPGLGWSSNYYGVFNDLKKFEETIPSKPKSETKSVIPYNDYNKLKNFITTSGLPAKANKDAAPFVVIIDEINRGNIAAIFGELITLIEESKRHGEDEQIQAILPYSKESFTVPNNLYIIGTMNTADRSVEALDAALRRRFSFIEMPPEYNLTELDYDIVDFKAFEVLKKINQRIEKLLDKDHMIGHSYFLKNGANDMLPIIMEAFYKNIIPLLQEYFFGDYGKIGLVLGKGFVEKNENSNDVFADFDHESSSQFEEREVFSIIDYKRNSDAEGFKKAIMQLMN